MEINLETPVIGQQPTEDLITSARRKLFALPSRGDLCPLQSGNTSGYNTGGLSLASLSSEGSPQATPPTQQRFDAATRQLQAVADAPRKKAVSFAGSQKETLGGTSISLPAAFPDRSFSLSGEKEDIAPGLLARAKLVSKGAQDHILVLSFPRVVCDFWSSCLFVFQVVDAYTALEKASVYRPRLRPESRRQPGLRGGGRGRATENSHQPLHGGMGGPPPLRRAPFGPSSEPSYSPPVPARLHFQQLAQRESQLLKMAPKEQLWSFWESAVTAVVQRQRGPNRTKVVPPVRIPPGLGERAPPTRFRPQTSRLRPLTARGRPTTARRPNGVFGEAGLDREAMAGPRARFHFIKVGKTWEL